MTAKKLVLYLTIFATSLAILAYGAKVIYDLGRKEVQVVNRDKMISDNAKYVSYVEKLLREEIEGIKKKVIRMDKQLVAISTKLKVEIIEE